MITDRNTQDEKSDSKRFLKRSYYSQNKNPAMKHKTLRRSIKSMA